MLTLTVFCEGAWMFFSTNVISATSKLQKNSSNYIKWITIQNKSRLYIYLKQKINSNSSYLHVFKIHGVYLREILGIHFIQLNKRNSTKNVCVHSVLENLKKIILAVTS